ncbi:MAG TPA: SDR family oxidoreductase [Pseudonocardia sp.]|nr:SDR family oxidoreductase [Pseudonocardia sp.]
MELRDRVVVVTGAGRGIGRALAEKMASEGARVVVNDLNADAVAETAKAVNGIAVPGDAASEAGVAALIESATEQAGPIDVFFANAGVPGMGGVDASEDEWRLTLEVNLLAHVRTARILVPQWLERGGGRLVVTASAAGLLTMPGAAPYSAAKHAVVAFAEWLSITYRDRGIVAQCLCPLGVDTAMLAQTGEFGELARRDGVITTAEAAEAVWQGMQDDRMLILTHDKVGRYYVNRAKDTDEWIRRMNGAVSTH